MPPAFSCCLYAMIDAANVYLNANDTGVLKYKPELGHGAEVLQELSDDAVMDATEKTVFDPPESNNERLLQFIKQHADIFDPQGVDAHSNILALSTCQSAENVERMLVFGTLTPAT